MRRLSLRPLVLATFCVGFAQAEPQIIHDSGLGVPTVPYKSLFSNDDVRDLRDSWIFGELPEPDPAGRAVPMDIYPITTERLTPKRFEQPLEGYFPRMLFPVCVVGDDELSLQWVKRNRRYLAESGAQCFLVSAGSAESVAPVLRLLKGIVVYPANGDAIADYFKIKHYPVLITDRYASQ